MAIIGDTVKLQAQFRTFAGIPANPATVAVTIYDADKNKLTGPVNLDETYKAGEGIYEYPFTIPAGHKALYYEFVANRENLPAVVRGMIVCDWQ